MLVPATRRKRSATDLQETDDETNDTVASQPSRVDLVHPSLAEESLDDKHERLESRESSDVRVDDLSGRYSVELVEGDVDGEATWRTRIDETCESLQRFERTESVLTKCRHKFDDRNFGLSDDLDALCEVGSAEDGGQGVEDGDLVLPVHAVRLDNEIDVPARRQHRNDTRASQPLERRRSREKARREQGEKGARAHPVGRYRPVSKLPNGITFASGH